MVILHGYGVVQVGITGLDAIPVLVLPVRVVRVIGVTRRSVRKLPTRTVTNWQTSNLRRMLIASLRVVFEGGQLAPSFG